jgi:hypothetical protein
VIIGVRYEDERGGRITKYVLFKGEKLSVINYKDIITD